MAHWMVRVARDAGLPGADRLDLSTTATVAEGS